MIQKLKDFGDGAKAITALIVLAGFILTGFAYFAKASDVRDLEEKVASRAATIELEEARADMLVRIAMVQKAFTEYSTRQTISQIRAAMREIEDRTGSDDPLHMGSRDRDDYRALTDELEYYQGILDSIMKAKEPFAEGANP